MSSVSSVSSSAAALPVVASMPTTARSIIYLGGKHTVMLSISIRLAVPAPSASLERSLLHDQIRVHQSAPNGEHVFAIGRNL
jgi:hypothetical protein